MTTSKIPIVSFIVPIFNSECFLASCLDSIINQTITDVEIICVNDASSDSSKGILEDYIKKDNRIQLIEFKENRGRGAARNAGIVHAGGTYLRMVDSDDFIPLDSTEKLLTAAHQYGSDFVRGGLWRCKLTGEKARRGGRHPDMLLVNGSFEHDRELWHFDQHTTYLYKTDLLKKVGAKYNESMGNGEDVDFIIQLVPYMDKVTLIPETVYYYRNHPDSVMHKKRNKGYYLNLFKLYALEIESLVPKGFQEQVDYFLLYHFSALLPNALLPSMPNNLSDQEAIEALAFLRRILCDYNIESLCFFNKYPWQEEIPLPAVSKQIVVLLCKGHLTEVYDLIKEIDRRVKSKNEINQLKGENRRLRKRIGSMYNSTSWRITSPLRKVADTLVKKG